MFGMSLLFFTHLYIYSESGRSGFNSIHRYIYRDDPASFGTIVTDTRDINDCFTDDVLRFMHISKSVGFELIMIEPVILAQTLNSSDMDQLKSQFMIGNFDYCATQSSSLIHFAMVSGEGNVDHLCIATESFSNCHVTNSTSPFTSNETLNEVMFRTETIDIKVIMFHRISPDAFWTSSTPLHSVKSETGHLFDYYAPEYINLTILDGLNDSSSDDRNGSSLKRITQVDLMILIPRDAFHFLSQLESSSFIQCNHQTAKKFSRIPVQNIEQDRSSQRNAYQSLIDMKKMAHETRISIFLTSGSLLGWFRECKAISYTTDSDFGTWAHFATPQFERSLLKLPKASLTRSNFSLYYIFGRFADGYEVSFMRYGQKTDLFFFYDVKDGSEVVLVNPTNDHLFENKTRGQRIVKTSGHIAYQTRYQYYYYPAFKLCSALYLGLKVQVSCTPQINLEAEYGPNWTEPIHDDEYDYKSSAFNQGIQMNWNRKFKQVRIF